MSVCLLRWKEGIAFVPTMTELHLALFSFESFKWTERKEEEMGYMPEHLLILPLTPHCIYYSIIPPIFFCPLVLSPSKKTKAREKKFSQMTNIAKQALKQPSGTVKFRCFRHVLNALKKVALLYGQLQGCKGICCISEVLRSPFSSLL